MELNAIDAAVAELLPSLLDKRPELVEVIPLTNGASRLSWFVNARSTGSEERLVLQRERVAGKGVLDVRLEAGLLRAASAAGVPVPAVRGFDASPERLGGAWMITERVPGESLPRRLMRDPEYADLRRRFAYECGRILAAIHTIPVSESAELPTSDPLDRVEGLLDSVPTSRPAFEFALRRLRESRPKPEAPAVVHGDFRIGNLLASNAGITAVLDWELAHVGDPLFDLGWLCARPWRFGGEGIVGGIGTVEDLLAGYSAGGGRAVAHTTLRWWIQMSSLLWGAICLDQARTHLSGDFRSVELALVGRRAAEMEYDLMRSLA
ncbi:MAG: phosphotransferase family protein [Marmoricola sp.]